MKAYKEVDLPEIFNDAREMVDDKFPHIYEYVRSSSQTTGEQQYRHEVPTLSHSNIIKWELHSKYLTIFSMK